MDRGLTGGMIARSVRWTYAMTAASLAVQLLTAAVLARLLTATDYGTVAVAAGALRFLQYLTDLGLGAVVVQKADFRVESDAPLVFAFGLGVNAVFAATLWLAAPLFLLAIPELAGTGLDILRALAVIGIVGAAGQTARGLLMRRLDFRRLGIASLAGLALGQGAVAIPLALAGFGAWSLVAGLAAQTLAGTVLAFCCAPHPLLPARTAWPRSRSILSLGSGFSLLRVLDSAGIHLLPLAVGMLAGMAAVGQWDRAWVLSLLPIEALATGAGKVLFPAFSRLSSDTPRLQRAWLDALALCACLLGSVGAGLAVAAPEIVRFVLGSDWPEVHRIVAPLALLAVLRGFAQVTGSLCEGSGRLRLRGLHQAGYLIVLAGAFAVLRPENGAAIAWLLLSVDFMAQAVLIVLAARTLRMAPAIPLLRVAVGLSVAPIVAAACAAAMTAVRAVEIAPAAALAIALGTCAAALFLALALHPSAMLRMQISERLLGQTLGISGTGTGLPSRLRRFLER
ncbi:MAG: oligosaccharide flippase family protein [Alphaproteobacteria bacterium]